MAPGTLRQQGNVGFFMQNTILNTLDFMDFIEQQGNISSSYSALPLTLIYTIHVIQKLWGECMGTSMIQHNDFLNHSGEQSIL